MKRRWMSIATALVAVTALALAAVAQDFTKAKFEKVPLKITGHSGEWRDVTITNTTGKTIQKGTRIFWYYAGAKDDLVLQADLPNGGSVKDTAAPKNINHPNEAYYLKLASSGSN